MPVVNPDGYLYTQTDNRLWRKTRKPNGNGCYGTDANRNFGYMWGTGGSSSDPCSDTYMGASPFSEIETANMRDWLTANKDMIKFYNNIHSYSQLILLPWGFSYDEPDNQDDLYRVASTCNDDLYAVHQKTYEVKTFQLNDPYFYQTLFLGWLYSLFAVCGKWRILGLDS